MKQIIVITGSKGSGKSTAAATVAPPTETDRMFVIDTEDSMSDITSQIKFGKYVRAYERFKPDAKMMTQIAKGDLPWVSKEQQGQMTEYYNWFVGMLDAELKQGKFRYLVIDTVEPIEAAFTAAVESNKKKFGWSGSRAYGKFETEGVRPLYENLLEAIAARGVEKIVLTTHIRRVWEEGEPILNKVRPGGRLGVLARLSGLMLWLVPNRENPDGAPAALVLKARKGKISAVNGQWSVQRVLPERIPHWSWADVDRYMAHPANVSEPNEGERMTAAEREMISEFLTDEQMKLMVLGAEMKLKQLSGPAVLSAKTLDPEMVAAVKELEKAGKPPALIAKEVGAPLPDVLRALREKTEEVAVPEDVNFGMGEAAS